MTLEALEMASSSTVPSNYHSSSPNSTPNILCSSSSPTKLPCKNDQNHNGYSTTSSLSFSPSFQKIKSSNPNNTSNSACHDDDDPESPPTLYLETPRCHDTSPSLLSKPCEQVGERKTHKKGSGKEKRGWALTAEELAQDQEAKAIEAELLRLASAVSHHHSHLSTLCVLVCL